MKKKTSSFLTKQENDTIIKSINNAENKTSGEIKLVVTRYCWGNLWKKAQKVFRKKKLDTVNDKNGVLILVVTTNQEFIIYGGSGIHEKVGQDFWDDVKEIMSQHFKEGDFCQGLCAGIEMIGEKLSAYFPATENNPDEISNEVEYEK